MNHKQVVKLYSPVLYYGRRGDICCFPGGSTSSGRHKGISLFKPTSRKGDFYEKWRKEIFDGILKYRVADSDFEALEKKNKIYICERHYSKDSIGLTNTGKKMVKLCALPTANLPPKSL